MNLAPNGKPSNLTPEQYKLVRTKAFKDWFGDWENSPETASKVVDSNGEPLVCYHGGKTKFNIFSPYSEGHYFTDNIKYAKAFVENNDDGYLFKCFINVRNYLDARKLSPPTPSFNEINEKELMMFFKKNGIYSKEMEESIKDLFANKFQPKTFWNYLRYYGSDIPSSYKEIYDAIFLNENTLNGTKINAYFVHKPNQIKLADGSNTTFDSNNNDIRFKQGGLLAPNGKPSNLNPEQYRLVRTPAFKEWFGDWENDKKNASKVLDENGEPLIVWHTSPNEFNIFDFDYSDIFGFHFGTKKASEDILKVRLKNKGNSKPYFLNIRKKLKIKDTKDHKSPYSLYSQPYSLWDKINIGDFDISSSYDGSKYIKKEVDKIKKAVQNNKNYDGYFYENKYEDIGSISWVVGNSNQIKLAKGTNTTFDSNNNDIRFDEGGLIAPNGKPSNLTPEQYRLVRTPAFKEWFGDWENDSENASKVVDENGEPLVVYHSTNSKWNIFKNEYIRSSSSFCIFLADSSHIDCYGGNVKYEKVLFCKIVNPFDISNIYDEKNDDNELHTLAEWKKIFSGRGLNISNLKFDSGLEEWGEKYGEPGKYIFWELFFKWEGWKGDGNLIEEIKKQDFDGIFSVPEDMCDFRGVKIAFNSNQIKLADGSNTTFDGSNPDIRYSGGGEVKVRDFRELKNFKDASYGSQYIDMLDDNKEYEEDKKNSSRWWDLVQKNNKNGGLTDIEFIEFKDLSGKVARYKEEFSDGGMVIPKGKEGDCYKNVQDYLLDNDLPNAFIVHGEVTNGLGKTIGHAWIVNGVHVIDPTTGVITTKEKYYERLNPKEEARYNIMDAIKMRFKTQNYGAWTDVEVKKILGNVMKYSGGGGVDDDNIDVLYKYLKKQKDKKIVFFTTSNRWEGEKYLPKSSLLAIDLSKKLSDCLIIDIAKLKIFSCEGNVSKRDGNGCGIKKALLNNKLKNPNNNIRCWASVNNETDEMYVVANAIFEADIVIFFGSIRWGKMNAVYTQIIERLTWLENRHTTLRESNLLKDKQCGVVAVGHNWNGKEAIKLEKDVLGFFGFKTPDELFFNWQFTKNKLDESEKGYQEDYPKFIETFNIIDMDEDNKFKTGGYVSYRDKYNKKYGYEKNESHSLKEISKDTGVSNKGLQKIYNKGIGAFKTNPGSVRPNVKSKEQWAKARVYSAVMGGKAARVDAKELKMNNGGEILLAPNGKPSNLTAIQYRIVRTLAFKEWFGDWERLANATIKDPAIDVITLGNISKDVSKLVDSNGEPLVVFRGMSEKSSKKYIFNYNYYQIKESGRRNKFGFYFTDNYDVARGYAIDSSRKKIIEKIKNIYNVYENSNDFEADASKNAIVKEYFVKINNYLDLRSYDSLSYIDLLKILNVSDKDISDFIEKYFWKKSGRFIQKHEEKFAHSKRAVYDLFITQIEEGVDIEDSIGVYFKNKITKKYNGVVFTENTHKKSDTYVAFEPNQIKLADGTNTTFDSNNNDIRFNGGGDLLNEPYISDNFQIGPNGAYEHTEENEIINQYADGVDLKKKLKKPKKPKGDCYYAAAQLVMENRFKHLFGDNNITYIGTPYLVHAEVRGQGKVANIRFGHAWVEDDENIYDYSNGNQFVMPKEIYYAIGDIDNQNPLKYQKYTFEEARRKMVTTRHYGEWDLEVDY